MVQCPHCKKSGVSSLRKLIISPGLLATCRSCNGVSGIRYPSWLMAMLPGSALMIAALFVTSESVEWGLNIVGFLLVVVIPLFFTPLHKETE